jgi:hypothetical protein
VRREKLRVQAQGKGKKPRLHFFVSPFVIPFGLLLSLNKQTADFAEMLALFYQTTRYRMAAVNNVKGGLLSTAE